MKSLSTLYENSTNPEFEYWDDGTVKTKTWYDEYHQLHREDGPAEIRYYMFGHTVFKEVWYNHGQIHRLDGPAIIGYHAKKDGTPGPRSTEQWWINGIHTRDGDKPAGIEYNNKGEIDTLYWMKDGYNFRDNGKPAIIEFEPGGKDYLLLSWYIKPGDLALPDKDVPAYVFKKLIDNPNLFTPDELDKLHKYSMEYQPLLWNAIQKARNASQEDLDALSI